MRLSFSLASLLIALVVLVDVAAVAKVIWVTERHPIYLYEIHRSPTFSEFGARMLWAGPLALLVVFSVLGIYKGIKNPRLEPPTQDQISD